MKKSFITSEPVCLDLFGRQLAFEILENLPYYELDAKSLIPLLVL